jgi:hypothetical protein
VCEASCNTTPSGTIFHRSLASTLPPNSDLIRWMIPPHSFDYLIIRPSSAFNSYQEPLLLCNLRTTFIFLSRTWLVASVLIVERASREKNIWKDIFQAVCSQLTSVEFDISKKVADSWSRYKRQTTSLWCLPIELRPKVRHRLPQ